LSHQRVLLAEGFTAAGHHLLLLLFGRSSWCSALVCWLNGRWLLLPHTHVVSCLQACSHAVALKESPLLSDVIAAAIWTKNSGHFWQSWWSCLNGGNCLGTAQTLLLARFGWWGVSLSCQRVLLGHEGAPQQWVTNLQHFCCSQGAAAVAGGLNFLLFSQRCCLDTEQTLLARFGWGEVPLSHQRVLSAGRGPQQHHG
jgi:hypothetical protein